MVKRLLVIITAVAIVVFGVYANTKPLNGITTVDALSESTSLFALAPFTFAIWWVIYVGLIGFAVYQFSSHQQHSQELRKASWWFVLTGVSYVSWLFFLHSGQEIPALVSLFLLLGFLVLVYQTLKIGTRRTSFLRSLMMNIPISLYSGWIVIMTISSIAAVSKNLDGLDFGLSPKIRVAGLIGISGIIAALGLWKRKDLAFASAIAWGIFGVYSLNQEIQEVNVTVVIVGILLLLLTGVSLYRSFLPQVEGRDSRIT